MNENYIINIGLEEPEKLFKETNEDGLKKEFRLLSSQWHPDKNLDKNTNDIFAHIKILYERAILKLKNGTLGKGKVVIIEDIKGVKNIYDYYKADNFELGLVYYGEFRVIYRFEKEYSDYINDKIKSLKNLKYANDKMKKDFSKFVPEIEKIIDENNYLTVIVNKKRDFITLKDLKDYKKELDIKHIVWMLSGLYNLMCFYYYNKIMFGGISSENVLVNPQNHEVYLIGGWWFSHDLDNKLKMLSSKALDIASSKIINTKKSHYSLDLDLIRYIGRELYGDIPGIRLRKDDKIPSILRNWLTECSELNPFEEYSKWQKEVLKVSFGERKFMVLDIDVNKIFKGE